MRRILLFLTITLLLLTVSVSADNLSDSKISLTSVKDIKISTSSLNFYDNSSYELKTRDNILQQWQPVVEYDKNIMDQFFDFLNVPSAKVDTGKISVNPDSLTIISYEVSRKSIKEQIVLEKPATRIYYRYDVKTVDKTLNTVNLNNQTNTLTFGGEYPYEEVTWVTEGNLQKQVVKASDNPLIIKKTEEGNLAISINGVDIFDMQKPFAVDADGTKYELDFVIDEKTHTVDIVGDLSKAQYPVTIDPTTTTFSAAAANDGNVERYSANQVYGTIRAGVGTGSDTGTYANFVRLTAGTTSNRYTDFFRGVQRFNTSMIPDGDTVTAVKLCTIGVLKSNGLGSFNYGITGFAPLTNSGTISTGDFQNITADRWADSDISYASLDVSGGGYGNNWTGNDLFKSNVSKTGWTSVMIRDNKDIDNSSPTWSSGATSDYQYGDIGDYGAVRLEVTYQNSTSAPVSSFTTNVTVGAVTLGVLFNDTSTGSPTGWNWSFGDGTWQNGTTQNTTHSYATGGNFTTFLISNNTGGSNQSTNKYITVYNQTIASFSTNVTSGNNPLPVAFTDTSSNTTAWNWSYKSLNLFAQNVANGGEDGSTTGFCGQQFTETITSNTTNFWQGSHSIKITTPGSSSEEGVATWASLITTLNPNTTYTSSVYVKGSGTVTIALNERDGAGSSIGTSYSSPITLTGEWTRYSVTRAFGATGRQSYTFISTNSPQAITFYVDGLQIEEGSTATTWQLPQSNASFSTSQNPTYTFTNDGNYTIKLNSSNSYSSNVSSQITYINVSTLPSYPTISSFTANVTSGVDLLPVLFTDTSSNMSKQNLLSSNQANGGENGTIIGFLSVNSANLTSNTTEHWQGSTSLKVVTPNSTSLEGFNHASFPCTPGVNYTASVYLKGTGTVRLYLRERTEADANIDLYYTDWITLNNTWTRYSVSHLFSTGRTVSLQVLTTTQQASTFYVDGLQIEEGPTPTTWNDPALQSWNYSFKNVTGNNTEVWFSRTQNPTYTFGVGNWSIRLNASNLYSSNISQVTFVNVSHYVSPPIVASFIPNITSGINPLPVLFNDTSQSKNIIRLTNIADGCEWGNTTGFVSARSATLSAESTESHSGSYSLKVVTPNVQTIEGFTAISAYNITPSTVYNITYWIKGSGNVNLYFFEHDINGTYITEDNLLNLTLTSTWTRYSVRKTTGSTTAQISIGVKTTTQQAATFYVDDIQIEKTNIATNWESPFPLPTYWNYSFKNVTGNNTEVWFSQTQNPVYTFGVGNWSIRLNASNSWSTNLSTQVTFVNVSPYIAPTPPVDFSINVSSGLFPLGVQFTNNSINASTWNWSFGDGTWQNGSTQNPTHSYTTGGNYTTFLIVNNTAGSNQSTNKYITVFNRTYTEFTANITSGLYSLPVRFNVSNPHDNATIWNWSFGDGIWQNGTTQNATHTYSTGGIYTVKEIASNPYATSTAIRSDYITVNNRTNTTFIANITLGDETLDVGFTDSSSNATSWYWNFGDGNTSTEQNPAYKYNVTGVFSVNHSSSNAFHTSWYNRSNYITVSPFPELIVDFTGTPTNGTAVLTVYFTDLTTNGPTIWNWSFGDGSYSGLQNPIHDYSTVGQYNVTLVVVNGTHVDHVNWTTKTGYIETIFSNHISADFVANITGGNYPLTVQFTDISVCDPACNAWAWDLNGDGSTDSIGQNPVYVYNYPMSYSPRLIASNGANTGTKLKIKYITVGPGFIPTPIPQPTITASNGYVDPLTGASISFKSDTDVDLKNSTYLKGWLQNFSATGNFNIFEFGTSIMAPLLHVFGFWIFLIIWGLYLFAVWVRAQDVTLPLIIGIISIGLFSLLFPKEAMPVIIIMFVICGSIIFVKLFKDSI